MTDSELKSRLLDHARAFDGLLSLIPAKIYYGDDQAANQWNTKKQTKAEAAAARRRKLDPDSELNRSAREVMDERSRNKRKLRELEEVPDERDGDESDATSDLGGVISVAPEAPREGMRKAKKEKPSTKPPKVVDVDAAATSSQGDKAIAAAHLSKKEAKKSARRLKKKMIMEGQEKLAANDNNDEPVERANNSTSILTLSDEIESTAHTLGLAEVTSGEGSAAAKESRRKTLPDSNSVEKEDVGSSLGIHEATASTRKKLKKQRLEPAMIEIDDGIPIASSLAPTDGITSHGHAEDVDQVTVLDVPAISDTPEPESTGKSKPRFPTATPELRARLAARIEALRAARKADGADGRPIRTRQELIESRRAKQAQRKEHKKELRRQAKLVGSGYVAEASTAGPARPDSKRPGEKNSAKPEVTADLSFGRVAFADGAKLSRDLSHVLSAPRTPGPSDPKTALLRLQNQKRRLAAMEQPERTSTEQKEMWLSARRRAEGDAAGRQRAPGHDDDEAALRRTVRRRDHAKRKSERGWDERVKGVEAAKRDQQRRREGNLQKRRDDKTASRTGKKKGSAKKRPASRPGFEGSLSLTPNRKKK